MAKSATKKTKSVKSKAVRAESAYNKFVREYAALCAAERREYTLVGAAEAWERKKALERARASIKNVTKSKSGTKRKPARRIRGGESDAVDRDRVADCFFDEADAPKRSTDDREECVLSLLRAQRKECDERVAGARSARSPVGSPARREDEEWGSDEDEDEAPRAPKKSHRAQHSEIRFHGSHRVVKIRGGAGHSTQAHPATKPSAGVGPYERDGSVRKFKRVTKKPQRDNGLTVSRILASARSTL